MIDVKQAIQKAKEFAADVLGQSDLLLEEVSSDDEKFLVTLSIPRRRGSAPRDSFTNTLVPYHARDREFKEFAVNKSDGTVTRMSIREVA